MAGYIRQDTDNTIAPGESADANDLDQEFDAIQSAMNASTGHSHNGSVGEGAPIVFVGPSQNVEVTATEIEPATNNTVDLGTTTNRFKDAYFSGNIIIAGDVDGIDVSELSVSVDGLTTDVSSLETRMATAESDISDIEALNTTQNNRLTTAESNITAIQTLNTTQNNRLTAVETKNTTQDTTLTSLQSQINALTNSIINKIYPVGSLYMSSSSTNPATVLGVGTWVAYAEGRAIVGVGTADGVSYSGGTTRGSNEVTLTAAQMPSHNHTINPPSTSVSISSAGSHTHRIGGLTAAGFGSDGPLVQDFGSGNTTRTTSSDGSHTHTASVNIAAFSSATTGSSEAHSNIQPSIGVYVWRRTG